MKSVKIFVLSIVVCLTTIAQQGKAFGQVAVDLGLPSGTLWASCNVGAKNPWEFGKYFAWGEITPKETYIVDNYKFLSYGKLTKYCTETNCGKVDNLTVLEYEDDAATAYLGNNWRMPTEEEFNELLNNCISEYTNSYKGSNVVGVIFKSKKNSNNEIFFPCAGFKSGSEFKGDGNSSTYLVSNKKDKLDAGGCFMFFLHKKSSVICTITTISRFNGFPIRAVFTKDTPTIHYKSYDAVAEKSKYDALINRYNSAYNATKNEVKQYEDDVNKIYTAYHSSISWNGKSTVEVTNQNCVYYLNKAITIAQKTIDPNLIERLNNSFEKFHRLNMGKQGAFTGSFHEDFWKKVYTVNAKNNESLDFEIFYFKTMYSIFQKETYYVDYNVLDRLVITIPNTSDRDRKADLFSKYVELCNMTRKSVNTLLSTPMCQSFVEEINRTRTSQATVLCDKYTKTWPNYQSDIYLPTEEVRLYNRLKDLEAKNSNELFKTVDLYLQKYSNSGYNISELIFKNFENLSAQESSEAVITMIIDHQDYIKQYTGYDTKLNDLLYNRLSGLDAEKSVRAMDNLINGNTAYMQTHTAYNTKIQTLYLTKLAEFDEGKRNEHILNAISDNKKYADKMKNKFNTIENAYTWIKTNLSADYYWTGIIDKYQTCFPTSVHKTELSKLRSSLAETIRQREEAERRRQEEERRAREARYASSSSSSSDLNKMDKNQLADWWNSHKGTKISFEWEDYFRECDGWAKRNYKFIGYVDECQWSEFYVNVISVSMVSSGLTSKENDDEVTSCVKKKYLGNHIKFYRGNMNKITKE